MIKLEANEPIQLDNSSMNTSTNSSTSSAISSSSSMTFNTNHHLMMDQNNNQENFKSCHPSIDNHQQQHQMIHSPSSESLCNEHSDFLNSNSNKTNLIVNYLPQNMTQDEIKSLFASIGAVDTCKLIKDKLSGQSLGYAFVNFINQDDAEKAIMTLNGMRLQNKTIKVSFARPSSESIKGANLYVCGLHKDFSQTDLENLFNPYGNIISSKILTDPKTGVSKGVGFVRFDQRIEAEQAIGKLNGKTIENMQDPLVVKFANSPNSIKSVMGLPLAPYVPACRGFYQPYRSTVSANYRYSPMNAYDSTLIQHQPTVMAAPSVPASQAVPNGMISSNPNSIPSTPVTGATSITAILPPVPTTPPTTSISNSSLSSINFSGWCIFVYNLGPETDESLLWQLFGPFGAVQSVKIIRDMQSHKCKGFGFVTMTNYEEAITAINYLNGFNLHNRILQVSFKTNSNAKPF